MSKQGDAAREVIRRLRARESLHTFALGVDIPLGPEATSPDEALLAPAAQLMALHHSLIVSTIERTVKRPFGRAIIMAPPGSAKSSYASYVTPPWIMGRARNERLLLLSYSDEVAARNSRRAQSIVKQENYQKLWDEPIHITREAADDWALSNGSECIAKGLTGAITSNRATGVIIDDPIRGRQEADSRADQIATIDSYRGNVLPRLLPRGWVIIIVTRWSQNDLIGSILPESYAGESGLIRCPDGLDWEVLNIQAKCERADDPLGRQLGEYLWPEWFPPLHWTQFENAPGPVAQREWRSLYQQDPTPAGSGHFTREMIQWYSKGELPQYLARVGASDFAVTKGKNDFTEHGAFGYDPNGNLWATDWWFEQCDTGRGIDTMLAMARRTAAKMWFNEGGVIDKAIRPALNRRMRELGYWVDVRSLPSMYDKIAKLSSFQARASGGAVYFPRECAWSEHVIDQLLAMPAGKHDDAADVCGLIGRGIDQFQTPRVPHVERVKGLVPFSGAWVEWEEKVDTKPRYR